MYKMFVCWVIFMMSRVDITLTSLLLLDVLVKSCDP